MSKMTERAKPIKEPAKPHGDKIKPDRKAGKKQTTEDKAQDKMMVPEKQGGIGGP
jgi:hypothetical protein